MKMYIFFMVFTLLLFSCVLLYVVFKGTNPYINIMMLCFSIAAFILSFGYAQEKLSNVKN